MDKNTKKTGAWYRREEEQAYAGPWVSLFVVWVFVFRVFIHRCLQPTAVLDADMGALFDLFVLRDIVLSDVCSDLSDVKIGVLASHPMFAPMREAEDHFRALFVNQRDCKGEQSIFLLDLFICCRTR